MTSTLLGTVIDVETKEPLSDVVVTATSPNMQGEVTVVTDKSGDYRISNLPPGSYMLRIDTDRYLAYARGGIVVKLGESVRANAELVPSSVG